MTVLNLFLEPFRYVFMQKALLAIVLIGINCSVVGTYIVLRRMSFISGALSHTILPGVVIAYIKGFSLFWGALAASFLTALGVGWISSNKKIKEDTAIGVVLSGMFALGVFMMSFVRSFRDFNSILFGSILGVTDESLIFIECVTLGVLLVAVLFHKELELTSFDFDYSLLIGIHPNLMKFLLLSLVSLSVVSAIQIVGALLTIALLITPAATACLLANTLFGIMFVATFFAVISGILGLFVSYYFQVASGASIVLICTLFFGLVWVLKIIGKYRWNKK